MKTTTKIAWAVASAGLICAVAAAYLEGGDVSALTAASGGLYVMAGVLGWTGKI